MCPLEAHSTQVTPNKIKTKKCEHSASTENIHILRTTRKSVKQKQKQKQQVPPSFDPTNDIPAQPKRIGSIQQSSLCPL
jgi:hypothetical protein